jgi:hypothetical protein
MEKLFQEREHHARHGADHDRRNRALGQRMQPLREQPRHPLPRPLPPAPAIPPTRACQDCSALGRCRPAPKSACPPLGERQKGKRVGGHTRYHSAKERLRTSAGIAAN